MSDQGSSSLRHSIRIPWRSIVAALLSFALARPALSQSGCCDFPDFSCPDEFFLCGAVECPSCAGSGGMVLGSVCAPPCGAGIQNCGDFSDWVMAQCEEAVQAAIDACECACDEGCPGYDPEADCSNCEECTKACAYPSPAAVQSAYCAWLNHCAGNGPCDRNGDSQVNCADLSDLVNQHEECECSSGSLAMAICDFIEHCAGEYCAADPCSEAECQSLRECVQQTMGEEFTEEFAEELGEENCGAGGAAEDCKFDCCQDVPGQPGLGRHCGGSICNLAGGIASCDDVKKFIELSMDCNDDPLTADQVIALMCKFAAECPSAGACDWLGACLPAFIAWNPDGAFSGGGSPDGFIATLNECACDPEGFALKQDSGQSAGDGGVGSECGGGGAPTKTGNPVDKYYGHKYETATDLRVIMTGSDFVITRSYSSDPDYVSQGLVGNHWDSPMFRYAKTATVDPGSGQCCRLCIADGPLMYCAGSCWPCSTATYSTTWELPGGTGQNIKKAKLLYQNTWYPVWRISEPGQWELDMYRVNDSGELTPGGDGIPWFQVSGDNAILEGLPLQRRDIYGNSEHYSYFLFETGVDRNARLSLVTLKTGSTVSSYVLFDWNFQSGDVNAGRLEGISVLRKHPNGWMVSNLVEYTYFDHNNTDLHPTALGVDGDLIQVVTRERVDPAPGAIVEEPVWRTRATQYRYHRSADDDDPSGEPDADDDGFTNERGSDHQLKMVIEPAQIEMAALVASSSGVVHPVEEYAAELLDVSDGENPSIGVYSPARLAAKVIERYELTTSGGVGRVLTQYAQSSCGCGGGTAGAQGTKLDYSHFTHDDGRTMRIAVSKRPEDSEDPWIAHRTEYFDTKLLGAAPAGGDEDLRVPRVVNEAIVDGSLKWVTHYVYDNTKRTLRRMMTPAAMATYIPSTGNGVEPVYTAKSGCTLPTSCGLVYAYAYTNDELELPTEVRVGNGFLDSLESSLNDSLYTLVTKTTYGDAGGSEWTTTGSTANARNHLVSKVERYRSTSTAADEVETTKYFYGFFAADDPRIMWMETKVEAETSAENGPSGSGNTYSSYELFDTQGRNFWSRGADLALTKRTYDQFTGALLSVERNATTSGLPSSPYYNLTLSGAAWAGRNGDGDSLLTQYVVDPMGRVRQRTMPGTVKTYTVREMRELPDNDFDLQGLPLYMELTLPHSLGSNQYAGPATATWYDAADRVVMQVEYILDSDYVIETTPSQEYPVLVESYDIDFETESKQLSKRLTLRHVTGLPQKSLAWHDVDANTRYETVFDYDELGRLDFTINPNGSLTQNTYDVLDRVIKVDIGLSDGGDPPLPTSMTKVAQYIYDSTTTSQGVGNGNLTRVIEFVDNDSDMDADTRHTAHSYDFRDRLVKTEHPIAPFFELTGYDNLDRVIKSGLYASSTSVPSSPAPGSGMRRYAETAYSQRGLGYMQRAAIDPENASAGYLEAHTWHDQEGRPVGQFGPNGPMTKTAYDGLGRPKLMSLSDRGSDPAIGGSSVYGHVFDAASFASVLTDDVVLEQTAYRYINDRGLLDLVTTRRRTHDAPDATDGDPSLSGSGFLPGGANQKMYVTTFSGSYYDAANRLIRSVSFGTNLTAADLRYGGSAPTISQSSPPDWDTAAASVQLVTATGYDVRGMVETTIDPSGQKTKFLYDDLNRRIALIENYVNGEVEWMADSSLGSGGRWDDSDAAEDPDDDEDRITSFVYDGVGNVVVQTAHASTDQVTEYVYGVIKTGVAPSLIASKDILYKTKFPDETSGNPGTSAAYEVTHAYNRQGELTYLKDQNGTVHEYERDLRGRVKFDKATTFGTNIDNAIKAIGAAYDDAGRLQLATSYDSNTTFSSGTTKNQVKFKYTPLGRVERVDQDHNGEVTLDGSDNPTGDTRRVSYEYDNQKFIDGEDDNFSRAKKLTYPGPSPESIDYLYQEGGSGGSVDSDHQVSRLTHIQRPGSPATVYAVYDYLGLGIYAQVNHAEIGVQLDRSAGHDGNRAFGNSIGNAGIYPGFDRYGRVARQMYVDTAFAPGSGGNANKTSIVEIEYQYDASSNRTAAYDVRPGAAGFKASSQYVYDELDRLTEAKRGKYDPSGGGGGGSFDQNGGPKWSQKWSLDVLGNWGWIDTDADGVDGYESNERDERTHNQANELTQRKLIDQPSSGLNITLGLTLDDAGNLRTEARPVGVETPVTWTYTHDAWNRLVHVQAGSSQRGKYEYNALNWRTVKLVETSIPADTTWDVQTVMYYSANWQLLEERIDEADPFGSGDVKRRQYIWGARYIDDLIRQRTDMNADDDFADAGVDKRYYNLTDVQFSTVALLDAGSSTLPTVVERVTYTAYGQAQVHKNSDLDGDADVDGVDQAILLSAYGSAPHIADLNRNGTIDSADLSILAGNGGEWTGSGGGQPLGRLSHANVGNVIGYDGYVFNPEAETYMVRFRTYFPHLQRWGERDPLFYLDSMNRYAFVNTSPILGRDPFGLADDTRNHICQPVVQPWGEVINGYRYWLYWLHTHPGFNSAELEKIKAEYRRGCIGVSNINIGGRGDPDLSNCFSTLEQAKKHQQKMAEDCACQGKKSWDGSNAKPVLFAIRHLPPKPGDDAPMYDEPDENGRIKFNWPMVPLPYNMAYCDPVTDEWLWARHGIMPDEPLLKLEIIISPNEKCIGHVGEEGESDAAVYCVTCNEWKTTSTRGGCPIGSCN